LVAVPVEPVVLPVEPVVLVDVLLVESVDVEPVGSVDAVGWVAVFVAVVGSAVAVAVAVAVGAVAVSVAAAGATRTLCGTAVAAIGATAVVVEVVDTAVVGGDCGCVAVHC